MNDNNEMPEAQRLWIQLAMSQKIIAEEAAKAASVMVRLGEIMLEG